MSRFSMAFQGIVLGAGHAVEVLGADVAERGGDIAVRVVVLEPAFLAYALRLGVAVIISAPYGIKSQGVEASTKQGVDRFWNQPVAPKRLADPIADFRFALTHRCSMETVGEHYAAAANRFPRFLQNHGIDLRRGEDRADDLPAFFHRRVRWPSRYGAYRRVARVSEQRSRVPLLPVSEHQSFRLDHKFSSRVSLQTRKQTLS